MHSVWDSIQLRTTNQILGTLFSIQLLWSVVFAEVDPIIIKGSKFFYQNNGSQFFLRAVFYGGYNSWLSPNTIDPLRDPMACERDIPHIVKMGINTLVLADVDPKHVNSGCMERFQAANLYVIVQCTQRLRINRRTRIIPDNVYIEVCKELIDSLHVYSNVLGFQILQEDVSDLTINNIPLKKIIIQELKDHMKKSNYRSIPVGITGFNHRKSNSILKYFTCGEENRPDWYEIRTRMEEVGMPKFPCTNTTALNNELIELYRSFSIPLVLGYFRCSETKFDDFQEAKYIFSDEFREVFSGALFDRWAPGKPNDPDEDGFAEISAMNVTLLPAFSGLSSQLASITSLSTLQLSHYAPPTASPSPCQNLLMRRGIDTYAKLKDNHNISSILPSKPNPRICTCKSETETCRMPPNAQIELIVNDTQKNCVNNDAGFCDGVNFNSERGQYGSYLWCNLTEKASWALEKVYQIHNQSSDACTSAGGLLNVPTSSLSAECETLLLQAGPDGTGTVTFTPTASGDLLQNNSNGSKSLPPGAVVGIGLFAGILIIFIAIGALRFRLKRKKLSLPSELDKPELPDTSGAFGKKTDILLDGVELNELDTVTRIELIELPASDPERCELPGYSKEHDVETRNNEVVQRPSTEKNGRSALETNQFRQ